MTESIRWMTVGRLSELPVQGARVVRTPRGDVAIFRTLSGRVFALDDRCPHKGGPLSQGIVHGDRVACPLHNWLIDLATGEVVGPDEGCTRTIPVELMPDGTVRIGLAMVSEAA